MKVRMKKILAGILACTMVVNLVPMEAWAAATEVVLEDQNGSEGEEALDEGESLEGKEVSETEGGEVLSQEVSSTGEGILETDEMEKTVQEIAPEEECAFEGVDLEDELGDEGISALAETELVETDVDAFKYTITNNTVTITGYIGSDISVVIPKEVEGYKVTEIGDRAFYYKSNLQSVRLPEGLVSIGKQAFYGCSGLRGQLVLPDSVTSIGANAFTSCRGLNGALVIPDSVISIGSGAFYNCTGFNGELVISNNVSSIGNSAFYGCSGLNGNLIISEGVTTIGNSVFQGCSGLNGELVIPDSVTSIGPDAFLGCSGLSGRLIIPNYVVSIGDSAFSNCKSFTGDLVIPSSVTSIGSNAFYSCSGMDGDLIMSNSITTLGRGAFQGCSKLSGNLVVPNSITSIASSTFSGCSGFDGELIIPYSVLSIGNSAFSSCSGLNGNLVIPDNVESIGDSAFNGCRGLSGDLIIPNSVTGIGKNAFYNCSGFDGKLIISDSVTTIGDYAFYRCNKLNGDLIIPDSITSIGSHTFVNCSGLNGELMIPDSICTIGSSAFQGCEGLTGSLVIPGSVTSIGGSAFYGCRGFNGNLVIPESVTSIGGGAFYGCSGFNGNLVIPGSVTSIGGSAFDGCRGFNGNLVIPDSVVSIGDSAFINCSGLNGELVIPDSVNFIGRSAFSGCSGFSGNLIIPNNVTSIQQGAFINCKGFDGKLVIPDSVTSIEYMAFTNCSGFKGDLTIPDSVTSIGNSAFSGCSGFDGTLTLPKNIQSIFSYAFSGCSNLKGILTIPDSVLKVDASAFSYCSSLSSIVVGRGVTHLVVSAFSQCSGVEDITFLGREVPIINTSINETSSSDGSVKGFFSNMKGLTTIWIPEGCYGKYVSAYSRGLQPTNKIKEIGSNEFTIRDGVLVAYTGEDVNVTIPDGVTEVGEGAFLNQETVESITFPEGIIRIGASAFRGCSALRELIIPNGVESIDAYTFYGCTALIKVTFPESLNDIGSYAFYGCTALAELILPEKLTYIGEYAFYGCINMAGNLIIPDGVTIINNSTFQDCKKLSGSLKIPEKVTSIGYSAFQNCSGFDGKLDMPEGVASIGDSAFNGCSNLKGNFKIPANVTSIGQYAFYMCGGLTGSLEIPENVTSIGRFAFNYCSGLSGTLTIPDGVLALEDRTFQGCTGITNIVLGKGIVYMNAGSWSVFNGCSGVKSITFKGAEVPIINSNITATSSNGTYIKRFFNLRNLETVWVPQGCYNKYSEAYGSYLPPQASIRESGAEDLIIEDGVLIAYKGTDASFTVPDNVTEIGEGAFLNNTTLESIMLPQELTKIGKAAFRGCTGLTEIMIPDGVTSIGDYAFSGCSGLTGIVIPNQVTSIGEYAFYNCTGMKGNLTIPDSVTSLGCYAFYGCNGLDGTLTLSEGIETIQGNTFYGCSGFTGTLRIPDSVISIDYGAFCGCSRLTDVVVGTGIKNLFGNNYNGKYPVFYNCKGIRSLTFLGTVAPIIADSVTATSNVENSIARFFNWSGSTDLKNMLNVRVPEGSFCQYMEAYCRSIPLNVKIQEMEAEEIIINDGVLVAYFGTEEYVTVPNGVTEIGKGAFLNNTILKRIILPKGVTVIGDAAFKGCCSLSEIDIPETVIEICDFAFYQCTSLSGELVIPDGTVSIGNSAFYGCTGLTGMLVIPDSVLNIYRRAFYGCSGFTDIIVGKNVKYMGNTYVSDVGYCNGPFSKCSGTESIVFLGEMVPIINGNVTATNSDATCIRCCFDTSCMKSLKKIYVSPSSLEKYQTAWGAYIPSTVSFSTDTLFLPVSNLCVEAAYSRSIKLSWSASSSSAVTGYYIYRDGVLVADITELTCYDSGLEADTEYTYRVTGHTETGQETAPASLTITTATPAVNRIYTENGVYKVGMTNSTLYAEVTDSGNLKSAVGRFYYVDESGSAIPISDALTTWETSEGGVVYQCSWDITQLADGDYTVVFKLTDRDGSEGTLSQTITVDHSVPDALSNVVAVGDTNQIVLSWSIAHEISTEKYHIYRRCEDEDEFKLIKRINSRDTLSYTDTKASKDAKYYYYVVAVNDFGQEGPQSALAVAKPSADTEAPQVVKLTPVNGSIIGGNVEFYAQAQDNVAAVRTELYLSTDDGATWTLLRSIRSNYCRHTLNTADYGDVTISVKGVAYDAAGNESDALAYKYKIDNTGPEKVTGLAYECTATTITLKWNDVADNDFSFFRVEQQAADGTFRRVQDVSSTLGVNIYNLTADTEYTYRVAAYDKVGNRGEASDVITVRTAKDTIAPVITAIKPNANYYNREISYSVTAKDNTAIASIRIQTSPNAVTWTDEKTYTFAGNKQTETAEGVLSLDSFAEGSLYIRGVARDTVGNESDTMSTAPYVQYVVDRTAPAVPKNLKLNVATGAIELTWDMGTEEDLEDYILYRSKDGSSYTQLVSGLHAVNYWDRSVEKGVTYFYKLAVRDAAGNVSGKTEAVQGVLPDDMEAPVIQNYVPLNGSTIGVSNSTFRVMVSDNWKVQNVKVTYTVNEDTEENTLLAQEINHYYANVNAALPVARMNDGDVLHLKVVVTDAQGLKTSAEDITYIVDKIAPRVNAVSAEGDEEKITIRWQGNGEEDLAGYRIYRKTAVGSYVMIAQRSAQEGTEYFYEDYNAEPKATYSYKVEAVDKYGNTHAKESDSVWLNVSPKVTAALSVEAAQEVNVEYFFDGSASFADLGIQNFEFDFGDGTKESGIKTKVIHSYGAVGTYEVTLRVTDTEGQTAEVKKTVTVEEAKLLGTVKVKAVDGNGNPIAGMPVYFDLDHTSENVKYSDVKGYASFVAGAGQYSIGAYKNGYLPAKRTVIVRANSETEIVLTMVKEPIVTGEFEVDRMTLDEIKAAGIDVTKPANQQVVKVKIHLTYGTTPITMNVITNGKDIYSDGTVIVDTDEGTRKLTPTIVDISGGNGEDYTGSDGESVIIAIMDVPVEASYLKEFFDVKLHIVNNASKEFELTNNVVTLNVPEGMSLVEGVDSSVSGTVRFDSLKGQEEKTIGWILRGDTAGEYHLEADYSAILSQFSAPVSAVFRTDTPITVYGMDAIKLVADINRSISYGGFYFNLSMQNIGGADMYLPTIDVMNGIVTAYQEAEEGKAKRVKTLSSLIKNASGYSQYLSADETVSKLSVGETYTKKYACYDTISTDDIARLLDAVYEIAEGMGIQVEVNMTDIDLYSIDSAEEKAESFYTDAQKADIYSYFIDSRNKNFYYYINALKDDKDFVKKLCELFYRTTDCALNLDMDLFTNQNMKDITRKYIYEMLMDETFLDATETKVDDTYLQALKSVIPQILEVLAQNGGLTEETQRAFESVLKERENMRSLALALKQGGKDGFWKKLLEIAETVDDSAVKMALEESLSAPMVSGWCGTALGSLLKEMDGVMQSIDRELEAWYESAELTNQLVTINAAQHEAKTLLQFILNHRDIHPAVYEEAQTIFNGLEEGFKTQEEAFNEELAKLEKQADLNARVEQLLNTKYYSNGYWGAGTVLAALKLVFNNLDDLFGWEESVNAAQSLQAAASITHALRSETMSLRNAGDAEKFLRALKYLVKIRLVGEKTYINLTKQNDGEKGLLASINRGQRANYKSLDAYYSVFRTTVLAYRDILFGDLASRDGIPEAPAVTIDYKKECTVQVFGAAYEYSFDGVSWTACEGSAISLNPGTAGCHLWVRVKESKENLAGNSAKIYIPERPEISEDVSVKYRNGTYRIEGLREGTYYYQLSDQELDAAAKELSFVQEKDAATEVQEDRAYEYMAIAAAATEKAFAGGTRNVRVQKACTVSLKNDAAGGTVQGAGEYYQGELAELMVTVKDGYRFLGWYVDGRLLSEETAYSFSVTEDVEIEARYELAKQIPVTFCGWRNSVLGTEYYNAGLGDAAEILVPNAPVPDGYRFAGWTLDGTVYQAAEIQRAVLEKFAAMDEIAVYAKFEQKTEKYMVTVQNGTLANGLTSSMYQVSSWVTVNADAPEDGKKFAYWMKDGVIVGYAASYTFYMPTKDTLITAVYENVAAEIEKVATTYIENVAPDVANSKLSFVSISMVPQECSILQAGIVATSDASKVTNGAELTTENADYVRGNATSAHNYKYTWTKGKVAKNQNWYVRAYLRYQDENGVVHEAYGDLVTANLEGIVK